MQLLKKKKKNNNGEKVEQLKVGTLIELGKEDSEDWKEFHKSKLERIVSNDEIDILAPMSKGHIIKLSKTAKYRILFKTRKGIISNLVQVIEYDIKDNVPLVKVKLLEDPKALQRRNSFRLDMSVDFKYDLVEGFDDEYLEKDIELCKEGRTVDISSTGFKFLSKENLEPGQHIKLNLKLNTVNIISIVSILEKEVANKDGFKYSYKAKIESIDSRGQENLAKCIFEIQRQLARKGCLL